MAYTKTLTPANVEKELQKEIARLWDDPLKFVRFVFPWGEPGPLNGFTGPDVWQVEFLEHLAAEVKARKFNGVLAVPPVRMARASGHGVGKSTLVAWLVAWIMCTRPYCQGTITANTFPQLSTKTWATIIKWMQMSLVSHWFSIRSDRIYHVNHRDTWFVSAQSCREENSEAFAGQHAASSTSFYIFDESSAIPDKIWEVAEGGLTDGEPMIFAFGNPTRSTGKFHRITFGAERERWNHASIDSRQSALTNKKQIQEWIDDYGEDSDFVRVRVKGLPPAASDLQFIDATRVYEAQRRAPMPLGDEPLVVGLDVARGGADSSVLWFRRGPDARSIPAIRIPGEECRDSMRLVTVLLDVLTREYDGRRVSAAFVDGTGIGGPIVDRCHQMGYQNVVEVQFGGRAPDMHFANMRAWMWAQMKDWLRFGSIPQHDAALETDITGPGYQHDRQDRLVLESKEDMKRRGLASPDGGDGLALTFAQPVLKRKSVDLDPPYRHLVSSGGYAGGWMA